MLFGALISPSFLAGLDIGAYAFALLAFVAARPIALGISLLGSSLTARERLAAAWFGPRGFSTMLYSLLILSSGIASAQKLFHIIAVIIVASILVYSSSDPLVARLFQGERSTDGERPASA